MLWIATGLVTMYIPIIRYALGQMPAVESTRHVSPTAFVAMQDRTTHHTFEDRVLCHHGTQQLVPRYVFMVCTASVLHIVIM